ncbi:MAG TPA: hypothetical protein VF041_23360 [Gemmatimonadaceae bacterium]
MNYWRVYLVGALGALTVAALLVAALAVFGVVRAGPAPATATPAVLALPTRERPDYLATEQRLRDQKDICEVAGGTWNRLGYCERR